MSCTRFSVCGKTFTIGERRLESIVANGKVVEKWSQTDVDGKCEKDEASKVSQYYWSRSTSHKMHLR
jgi:hypothetical protein